MKKNVDVLTLSVLVARKTTVGPVLADAQRVRPHILSAKGVAAPVQDDSIGGSSQ